ncbi:LysR family transcriptional regulator [Rhodococcus sp. H29-C3]|uniref:LysR family transcriptional regulator n=1 Tax=Rhodococcus sp. H29-C3 TaxID=3046307 RepID=UPI0024BABD75|nr:LysR family transcriptional regulator [Rhodococcus sp. H29-C3]MDJ0362542.1 LysR family transcriptional regulator [Rhodococcus sp. H29-C3]
MIDPSRMQTLRAIEHHGSIAEVARVMHLTPSAISQQIRQLSDDVGASLLEREGRSVRLTPAAHTLLRYSHRAAAVWEEARADLDLLVTGDERLTGHLAMCGFATAIPSLVAPTAHSLTKESNRVTVSVREASTAESLTLLLQQSVDVAVIAAPTNLPFGDPRFEQKTLLDDPQDLVAASNGPLGQLETGRLQDADREYWIEPHIDQRRLIEAACSMEGFVPNFRHQANEWNAVLALVKAGMGVCLYPRMAPLNTPGVHRIVLSGSNLPIRRVLTCVRAGSSRQPLISRTLQLLEQTARRY